MIIKFYRVNLTIMWREEELGDEKTTSDFAQGTVMGLERTRQIQE